MPFCAEEYVSPPPQPINTFGWVKTTRTETETLFSVSRGATTGIPVSTHTFTFSALVPPKTPSGKLALMTPAPSQISGYN
jgi:hypothetical protein